MSDVGPVTTLGGGAKDDAAVTPPVACTGAKSPRTAPAPSPNVGHGSTLAGLHAIAADVYHADLIADQPTLSKSIIQLLINHSPAHARHHHPKLNPNFEHADEQRFDVGTAAHDLFLEGIDRLEIIGYDDWRTAAAKEARDIARADGRIPLLAKQAQDVQAMCAAIRTQLDQVNSEPALFTDGKAEQTLVWEERGVLCRARLDWLRDDLTAVDDLKSTRASANPEAWTRSTLWSVGADVQAAFYSRGVEAVTGSRPDFRFAVIETTPPYALSVIAMGPDVLTIANKKIDWALDLWRRCLERDEWPAYEPRVAFAELPAWEEARWLQRELREVAA